MPYPKLKSETYHCQGGINTKVSLYIANEGEFLALQNVDFRTVGALSSFAGSTVVTTSGSTSRVNGIGGYYNSASAAVVATDFYNASILYGSTLSTILSLLYPNTTTRPTSFALGASALFGANNWDFWTYQGSTVMWQFSLGKPYRGTATVPQVTGGTAGPSGILRMFYSLVRSDGFIGPAYSETLSVGGATAISFRFPIGANLSVGPGSGLSNGSFGLSGIYAWMQLNNDSPVGYGTSTSSGLSMLLFGLTSGIHRLTIGFGYTLEGWWVTTPQPQDFQGSFLYGLGSTQGAGNASSPVNTNNNPFLCETYANQLFTVPGEKPSRLVYSNPGEPEKADYENFIDVGISDPNGISALKSFFTQLVIWKYASTWALSGTGPDTFVLSQVSSIYGCLGHRAACVWNQNLWFLDEKGIFEFNGANTQCVSNKVEPYFRRMNVNAAATEAVMVHVKDRNEVWCAIPIDGATVNNLIVVYDYLSNGWTTRTVPNAAMTALSSLSLGVSQPITYYGASSGLIGTFGSSLVGDAGTAFTSIIKSRFIEGDMGNTVTKMFRRLYVDSTVTSGMTYPITVNLYADKSSTPYLSTTMGLSQFQNRIDFGIPAKSVAVELIYNGSTFFQLNGFTIEYRYQRNT